jgi:hypothetical protein
MSDEDQPGLTSLPSASVPDLIDDYRQEQQAVRLHARELARLRGEVLSAADREAAEIVVTARANIRRIIVSARHDLLELAEQVQIISGVHGEPDAYQTPALERLGLGQGADSPDRLLGARHDVRRVIEEVRPELESLAKQALVVSPHARRPAADTESVAAAVGSTRSGEPAVRDVRASVPTSRDEAGTTIPTHDLAEETPRTASSLVKRAVAIFAIISAVILVGSFSWTRSRRAAPAPQKPASSAERGSLQPRAEPSVTVTPTPAVAEPQAPKRAPLLLRVSVARATWVRTTIDGRADAGGVIQIGETKAIAAQREVSLRVGDAGAVRVSLNGAEAAPLGRDGEVVTRRFALDQPASPISGTAPAPRAAPPSTTPRTPRAEDGE